MKRQEMATKLHTVADRLDKFAKENPSLSIAFVDAGNMRALASMVEHGEEYSQCLAFAGQFETAVREEIPLDVWNFLLQYE